VAAQFRHQWRVAVDQWDLGHGRWLDRFRRRVAVQRTGTAEGGSEGGEEMRDGSEEGGVGVGFVVQKYRSDEDHEGEDKVMQVEGSTCIISLPQKSSKGFPTGRRGSPWQSLRPTDQRLRCRRSHLPFQPRPMTSKELMNLMAPDHAMVSFRSSGAIYCSLCLDTLHRSAGVCTSLQVRRHHRNA
jgi:hypothetical protein